MDQILSSIGLGSGVTGALYDANTAASTPAASSGGTSWWSSIVNFAQSALPVAAGVNNLVNADQGRTAQNNAATASGSLASVTSNPIIWIGAIIVGVVLVVLLIKKP